MTSWFVSTTRTVGTGSRKEVEWLLNECATEHAAKEFAAKALIYAPRNQTTGSRRMACGA